jgi:hypothetical protein
VKIALYLLGLQELIGAFDTIYYHEWKARLPARGRRATRELAIHAFRDFFYGILFISLPWFVLGRRMDGTPWLELSVPKLF